MFEGDINADSDCFLQVDELKSELCAGVGTRFNRSFDPDLLSSFLIFYLHVFVISFLLDFPFSSSLDPSFCIFRLPSGKHDVV
jgi:hypothetical protein